MPSGLAENFPAIAGLKAIDLPRDRRNQRRAFDLGPLPLRRRQSAAREGIHHAPLGSRECHADRRGQSPRALREEERMCSRSSPRRSNGERAKRRSAASSAPPATTAVRRLGAFKIKADDAVLAAPEFGLAPIKVDEWSAEGSVTPERGPLTLSRFVIRSGTASIELAGQRCRCAGISRGSSDRRAQSDAGRYAEDSSGRNSSPAMRGNGCCRTLRGGQVLGGKVAISLEPGELARMQAGAELAPEAVNVELDLAGMSLTYVDKLPPILTGSAKMTGVGDRSSGSIFRKGRLPCRRARRLRSAKAASSSPTCVPTRSKPRSHFKAGGRHRDGAKAPRP